MTDNLVGRSRTILTTLLDCTDCPIALSAANQSSHVGNMIHMMLIVNNKLLMLHKVLRIHGAKPFCSVVNKWPLTRQS